MLRTYRKNIKKFILNEFNIDKTIKPVHDFCSNPKVINRKLRLDYFEIIQNLKKRIKDLEYMKDDKIAINQNLINEIKHLELRFQELTAEKQKFEEGMRNQLESANKMLNEQAEIIKKQKQFIGGYKSSIIYPFYRITHTIGKTKTGKILQKLLK